MAAVYMLRCADGSYYVGSTRDLDHRMHQHGLGKGSEYTSTRMPVELVWAMECEHVSQAYAIERKIHGWSRAKKERLIEGAWDAIRRLSSRRRGRATDDDMRAGGSGEGGPPPS